jgi:hypothetical protein
VPNGFGIIRANKNNQLPKPKNVFEMFKRTKIINTSVQFGMFKNGQPDPNFPTLYLDRGGWATSVSGTRDNLLCGTGKCYNGPSDCEELHRDVSRQAYFIGDFEAGMFNGMGKTFGVDGSIYTGKFKDDVEVEGDLK